MLYFVRHGETDHNKNGIKQGWQNNPINETGVSQCRQTAKNLCNHGINKIFSSDLKRGEQSAQIFAEILNAPPPTVDARLREYGSGDLEGMKKSERSLQLYHDFLNNPHKYNAEDHLDVYTRVRPFVDELRANHTDNALIVVHGAVYRMLTYCIHNNEWNAEKYHQLFNTTERLGNCQVTQIDIYKSEKELLN
jgi:broad specificity phosphatase PhoE